MNDETRDWPGDAETRTTGSVVGISSGDLRVPGLTVLGHPDRSRVGDRLALPELTSGRAVLLSRLEPSFLDPVGGQLEPLLDTYLSRTPLAIEPRGGGWWVTPRRSRTRIELAGRRVGSAGAMVSREALDTGVVLTLGRRVVLLFHLQEPLTYPAPDHGLVGESAAILRVRREIERLARVEVPVLLRGETGTGKELVAAAIHRASPRRDRPLVVVNMAAIPPTLAASELFGAERGSYTGAERRKSGFFQKAEGGTLFLDEIGETPLEIQALLLRALENHEIQPVGAVETRRIDVRVLAATDADLELLIQQGSFRGPLLHRLAGYEIRLPPLRHRRDDIGRLMRHFIGLEQSQLEGIESFDTLWGEPFPPAWLVARFVEHDWPGNVRELANAVRRILLATIGGGEVDLRRAVAELLEGSGSTTWGNEGRREKERPGGREKNGDTLDPFDPDGTLEVDAPELDEEESGEGVGEGPPSEPKEPPRRYRRPAEIDDEELLAALRAHDWALQPTAKSLGVSRGSLYLLIESCSGIRKAVDLEPGEIEAALAANGGSVSRAARQLEVSSQGLKRRLTELGISSTRP